MRLLIQRVLSASVTIDQKLHSNIDNGALVLIGITHDDTVEDLNWLIGKLTKLRIFDDENGVMNLDIQQIDGEFLVVSQFTLYAATKKGNRPSYIDAAREDIAIPLYEEFLTKVGEIIRKPVKSGLFGAHMQVELVNDGPVTIWIDSKNR